MKIQMRPSAKVESVFITEVERDGVLCAGPNVRACSWEEANSKAQEQGTVLVGKLNGSRQKPGA
jgi:hypothetical protein